MTVAPTSKYQIVTSFPLPGTCAGCNKSANGSTRFVDFQLQLDWYGAVAFCEDCCKEMLICFDFVESSKLSDAYQEIKSLSDINRDLEAQNASLRSAVDSILAIRPDLTRVLYSDSPGQEQNDSRVDESSEESSGSDSSRGPESVSQSKF